MDCSLPGSFVHGIFQARILEWVARGSSRPRDRTCLSCIPRQILYHCAMIVLNDYLPKDRVWKEKKTSHFTMEKLGCHHRNQTIKVKVRAFTKGYCANRNQSTGMRRGQLYGTMM